MVFKYLSYLYSANNNILMLPKLDIPMFKVMFSEWDVVLVILISRLSSVLTSS